MARRTALASTTAGTLAPDPIFAAISRYRHACAELRVIDERTDPARYAAAEAEIDASSEVLFAIKPATIAGAATFARLFVEDGQDHWAKPALMSSEALPQLGGPSGLKEGQPTI